MVGLCSPSICLMSQNTGSGALSTVRETRVVFLHEGADGSLDGGQFFISQDLPRNHRAFSILTPALERPLVLTAPVTPGNTPGLSDAPGCGALPVSGPLGLGCCGFLKQKQELLTSSLRRFVCFTLRVSVWRFR